MFDGRRELDNTPGNEFWVDALLGFGRDINEIPPVLEKGELVSSYPTFHLQANFAGLGRNWPLVA